MCGICGYVGTHLPGLLERMCDRMVHRGPDDGGVWYDEPGRAGLGHRRLSIIDTSRAGHQPMSSLDGRYWLTYNGEIYDFQAHRAELTAKGYRFTSRTDSEVLLKMYAEYGPEMLTRLNGMFAFAIWDAEERTLFIARDHVGIKPFYYWEDSGELYFASEVKALLAVDRIPRRMNSEVLTTYLTLLWVPGEETMFEGIKKLEPGHCGIWKAGELRTWRWFDLTYVPDGGVGEKTWVERVHDTFCRATARQMVSDVPVGAFLSGGLDSSAIMSCMRRSFPDREIHAYTMAFESSTLKREGITDDFPYALRVARHLGVRLEHSIVEPDAVSLLPKVVFHLDEPDADPTAILTYMVSRLARDDGARVLLSGTGGDEVFFGYNSHIAFRQYERMRWLPKEVLSPLLGMAGSAGRVFGGAQGRVSRRTRRFRRGLAVDGLGRHLAIVDWSDPATRASLLSDDVRQLASDADAAERLRPYYEEFSGQGILNRHSHVLMQTFLAAHNFLYNDKCGMAASVETRVPFLDVELIRLAAQIPESVKLKGGTTKAVLKKAMERYLPAKVIYRDKTGFTPPLREWVATRLDTWIRELLSPRQLRARGIFDPVAVEKILRANASNRADHGYIIYAILNLELWFRTFIDQPGVEVVV